MSTKKYILPEDRLFAEARIAELEAEIQGLGPEFYEALTQSNETWHDNAPFDALRERQSVMAAELQSLRETLRDAAPGMPRATKNTAGIGSLVILRGEGGKTYSYKIAGHWTPNAGSELNGVLTVSCLSPVAQAIIGKKLGSEVAMPPRGKHYTIQDLAS